LVAQARGRRLQAWHADTCPACGRMPKEKRRIHEHGTDRHSDMYNRNSQRRSKSRPARALMEDADPDPLIEQLR